MRIIKKWHKFILAIIITKTSAARMFLLSLLLFAPAVLHSSAPTSCGKIILAYYPYWVSAYKSDKIPYNKLTHICHAFADTDASGNVTAPSGFLEPNLNTNAHAAGVKVLVSIGGASDSHGNPPDPNFRTISKSAALRTTFANNIYQFCKNNNYDGVDIDWEYPGNTGDNTDKANFVAMIKAIRDKFNASPAPAPTWQITIAISTYIGSYLDFTNLNTNIDYYNVMTYDMNGSWSNYMGYNAPLYQSGDTHNTECDVSNINYMLSNGATAAKIDMGLPFYGYDFTGVTTLFQSCGGNCNTITYNYQDIVPMIGNGWTYHWDGTADVPYLTKNTGSGILTYDDPQSIDLKCKYALNTKNLGGIFMWDLSADYIAGTGQPLMDTMYNDFLAVCPNGSPTPTSTPTQTATKTPTPSTTSTSTVTPTITSTGTPTATKTGTQTNTPTGTNTQIFTATSTPTITMTQTNTPSYTVTSTNTQTFTVTPTSTESPTSTISPTASVTQTVTTTSTETDTPSVTPTNPPSTATPTVTITLTYTPTPPLVTATVTLTSTPGRIPMPSVTPIVYPNPWIPGKGSISIKVGYVFNNEDCEIKIYTNAYRLVYKYTKHNVTTGQNTNYSITLDPGTDLLPTNLAPGAYYIRVRAVANSYTKVIKFIILK